ncbi:MAG: cbb3-type cytochrome oxidase assembly protein CcoS [Usitatibacter sp.]
MEILYLLVPLSVVLAFAIGAAFWLAVDAEQFDDLEGPGLAVILDDDDPRGAKTTAEEGNVRPLT